MSNIVGEPFLPYVVDQINTRQTILGRKTRDTKDLTWMNAKTSWVRLASSVNIESQTVLAPNNKGETVEVNNEGATFRQKYLGLDSSYGGNRLAKEYILFGGTSTNSSLRSGITDSNSSLPSVDNSYGLGGTEFGIKPMSGIESFSLKSYNNGTLREATLKIIANNRKQFEYIDSLYLRLGYTMFLEWGNTTYPKSITNGVTEYATPSEVSALSLINTFLEINSTNVSTSTLNSKIEDNRSKSKGNYDGFVGIVKNFTWSYNVDGTYTINLILISVGSVIESLKINNQVEGISYLPSGSIPQDRSSALATFIDLASNPRILSQTTTSTSTATYEDESGRSRSVPSKSTQTSQNRYATKTLLQENEVEVLKINSFQLEGITQKEIESNKNLSLPILACNATFGGGEEDLGGKSYNYLRFGSLLNFINKKLFTYDLEGNPSFVEFDTSTDTYIYSNGWSFSSDPSKLIVRFRNKINGVDLNFFDEATAQSLGEAVIEKFHDIVGSTSKVGRLMNVYFEAEYLKDVLKNNQDSEDGGVYLNKFIDTLINDVNVCLGNVNKIKYRVTQAKVGTKTKDVIQFYDEVPIYGITKNFKYDYELNLYGFNNNEGSFVTDYGIQTGVTKRLQSQIAIGAQAGGQAVGIDSTAIGQWNIGLVDRINPSKIDSNQVLIQRKNYADFSTLANKWARYLLQLAKVEKKSVINIPESSLSVQTTEKISTYTIPNLYLETLNGETPFAPFQTIQSTFFSKSLAGNALFKKTPSPVIGFLPINLTVTLDGISGVRIFDKLIVDSRFLPPNYGNTLEFVITGVDHEFVNNKWVTKLETISIPKLKAESEILPQVDISTEIIPIVSTLTTTTGDESFFRLSGVLNPRTLKLTSVKRVQSIDEILTYLNSSPIVQERFRNFFNSLLETFPTGYIFQINDIGRPLVSGTGVGYSHHKFYTAIDMSILNSQGEQILGLKGFQNPSGVAKWRASQIPQLAEGAGLFWGGTWTTGDYPYDTVHFDAFPDYQINARKTLLNSFNNFDLISSTTDIGFKTRVLNKINLKDFLYFEEGKPASARVSQVGYLLEEQITETSVALGWKTGNSYNVKEWLNGTSVRKEIPK
jgi:hypothetical protein